MENALIQNRDFIIFGLQPWDIPIGSNCKNIAAEIAKHNRVLYVNRPLDRITSLKKRNDQQTKNRLESIKKGKAVLTKIDEQLWVLNPRIMLESINFLPPGFFYNYLNKSNNKKLAAAISEAAGTLNFKDPILLTDNDFFNGLYLKEYLKPSFFIYYIRDYILSQKYFLRHGTTAEPLMIKKANVVAANSQYLANYAGKYNPNSADIGQGCEVEEFLEPPAQYPEDLNKIGFPRIGYCGSLTATRLDIRLLHFIASEQPNWNIVLVGPEDDAFRQSDLHTLKNVYFLGSKQPAELPAYTHSFDVCINPQLLNQMTIGNYPRKVDEYLAAGKPVVATKTETMGIFGEAVYLCDTYQEYLVQIQKAMQQAKNTEKIAERKKLGMSHTWAASVTKLYKLIIKYSNHDRKS